MLAKHTGVMPVSVRTIGHRRCGGSSGRCGGSSGRCGAHRGDAVAHRLEMWWLIGSAPDFWGRVPGFESGISHNDPDALQDYCVIR